MKLRLGCLAIGLLFTVLPLAAQTGNNRPAPPTVQVPRLIRLSGTLSEPSGGNPEAGVAGSEAAQRRGLRKVMGVTFALYSEENGGAPLWLETRNVEVDENGRYTVMLGSSKADGLPLELFTSSQAQWLGIRPEGEAEQPRIMLLSVPYALKAADAETLGGKPPSAYATTQSGSANNSNVAPNAGGVSSQHQLPLSGSGVPSYNAIWLTANELGPGTIWNPRWVGIFSHSPVSPLEVDSDGQSTPNVTITATGNASGLIATSAATSGAMYGVAGSSASSSGAGVNGKATSATGTTFGVYGFSTSGSGVGTAGVITATTGGGAGVVGQHSSSTGAGVVGTNFATSGNAIGIGGVTSSTFGVGIFGTGVANSDESQNVTLRPVGVWGDTNQQSGVGVLATADSGIAFAGYNNAENISTAKLQNDETIDENGNIFATRGPHFGGICVIDVGGNLGCNGSKSAIVPVDGGTRKVALYAMESPENWFEDFGSAQLANGSAVISLESVFEQTVNTGLEYHVFLTPKGDCKGLFVTNESAGSFEVRELGGGKSNIAFDYRIVARRKGYEKIRLADRTKHFDEIANDPGPVSHKVTAPVIPHPVAWGGNQK